MADFRWTAEQLRVLLARDHALLSANAGTGKTETVIGKIGWLLGLDVGPGPDGAPVPRCPNPCRLDEIAAITFTERAACELKEGLRERIEASGRAADLRWEIDRASVGTIHGFCAGLLRDHALRLGIDPTFRILDERESVLRLHEIIREEVMEAVRGGDPGVDRLLERFGLHAVQYASGLVGVVESVVREVRWHRERYEPWLGAPPDGRDGVRLDRARLAKLAERELGGALPPEDVESLALADTLYDLARRSVGTWLAWLEEENVRDYDSLILDVRRLLARPEHRPALESIRRGLRILIIDEFQDTDGAQRDIAFALAGLDGPGASGADGAPRLLLVGDPKQSIYRFRGADLRVWNEVRERLCGDGEPLRLTRNFRTQPGVVDFVNRAASSAIESSGEALEPLDPGLRIPYSPLAAHRSAGAGQGVDWLDCSVDGRASDRHRLEARLVVSRIRALLADGRVPAEGTAEGDRAVRRSDIAVLCRTRRGLEAVDRALREAEIAAYNAAGLGLADRQEVLDLVTVLRLLVDTRDDYHGAAYLRSPFVGLRDEVVARIRLDRASGGGSLLRQARRYLRRVARGEAEWFAAPEHPEIAAVEREALARGLSVLEEGRELVDRVDAAQLLEEVVRRTGYRLHLLLRPGAPESLAAIERFTGLLDEYRRLPVGSFLDLWDRWGERDLGLPQAPLHSAADDVVTLQTIHTAKGLEWPIVFLLRAGDGEWDRLGNSYLADPGLGPALMSGKSDRGPRQQRIAARETAAERAEEARLLYVALTRARDRLVVSAPDVETGYMEHLRPAFGEAVSPHAVGEGAPAGVRRPRSRASADDPATGTGGQLEAFGDDDSGQLDIFRHASPAGGAADPDGELRTVVYREPDPEQGTIEPVRVALSWLDGLVHGELSTLAESVRAPARRRITSATELRLREADEAAWRLRYLHGVEEAWRFAPRPDDTAEIPASLRGTLIHGVLERIEAVEELSRLLNETLADVDAPPGAEELLEPGMPYRRALEAEIERVVTGDEWKWYVRGEHYRELRFLVLAGRPWRAGAIDLYRP
ncbi:MAG: UvrD-helicase domain-containing protein, partial [Gemmatimonadota bacterium]